MPDSSKRPHGKHSAVKKGSRTFEADAQRLMSLRLIAAPDPKDDLSDSELEAMCKDPLHSPELIQQLIEFVKNM